MNWPPITSIDAAPPPSSSEAELADGRAPIHREARGSECSSAIDGRLVVVAPASLREPLHTTLTECGLKVDVCGNVHGRSSDSVFWRRRIEREITDSVADAALVVISTEETVDSAVPGPVIGGIPAGVVTADSPADLQPFLQTITRPTRSDWAVFAMGKDDYLNAGERLLERARRALDSRGDKRPLRDCRADRCSRPEACRVLARGPALSIYAGHAQPHGWSGYQALRWKHLAAVTQRHPIGSVIHLSCNTVSGSGERRPFAARFVGSGRAGASLGSLGSLPTTSVTRLAELLGATLETDRVETIGDILLSLERRISRDSNLDSGFLDEFRLIGSPLQPIW